MKRWLPARDFLRELGSWGVRSVAGASWSFSCAYASGFNSRASLAGMSVGVACWIFLLARYSVQQVRRAEDSGMRWVRLLKRAAWIRSVPAVAGLAVIGMVFGVSGSPQHALLTPVFWPDVITSAVAYALASPVVRWAHLGNLEGNDAAAWIALVTAINGGLIMLQIAFIAGVLARFRPKRRGRGAARAGFSQ